MKRLWFLTLALSTALSAASYDRLLIEAQALMYPKVMLLEQGKEETGTFVLAVLHEEEDAEFAALFKKKIESKYGTSLAGKRLNVVPMSFEAFFEGAEASAVYGLKSTADKQQRVTDSAKKRGIASFAYSYDFFAYDYMMALVFRERPVLYLNKKAFEQSSLKYHQAFYKVVKFYDKE